MRLTFLDALKFGIPEIDQDHERILRMLNEIGDCINAGNFDSALRQLIHLIAVERRHAAMENCLLKEHSYKGLAEHSLHHKRINERLSALMEAIGDGAHDRAKKSFEALSKSVLDDILLADLPFKSLLQYKILNR